MKSIAEPNQPSRAIIPFIDVNLPEGLEIFRARAALYRIAEDLADCLYGSGVLDAIAR